jgi:hypothetical protein
MKRAKKAKQPLQCMQDVFGLPRSRAPASPLEYRYHEVVDARPLRPGEKVRLFALIRGSGINRKDEHEERCAAAYVAAGIGLVDALPVLKEELEKGIYSRHVEFTFRFAVGCLEAMQENGEVPSQGQQLINLLRMRDSDEPAERRYADIVLRKADIKYGTVTSW